MKILLTGASGFIGRNYLDESTKKSIHVITREPLEHPGVFKNYIGDINDLSFLKKVIKNKFDLIVHCAWQGLPDRNPVNNQINLDSSLTFIDLLSSYPETKNIFIGSCLEYGDLTGVVNELEKGKNLTDFGKTKSRIHKHVLEQNLQFTWLRPFYLYGRYQHSNALVNYIHNRISTGQEIQLQNPDKAHDFVYVIDLIRIIRMIEKSNISNEIFNVGSGTLTSVTEMFNLVNSLIHKNKLIPSNPSNLEHTAVADIKKAKEMINWSPEYSIYTGVKEVLKEKIHD
jgi:nucleoside-diphosphate-sugar epimerase